MWANNAKSTASSPIESAGSAGSALVRSARMRIPTPRSVSSWIRFKVSRTVRPSRSRVCTKISSPHRANSSTARNPGRSAVAPDFLSR